MQNMLRSVLCTGAVILTSSFASTIAMAQQPLDIVVRPIAAVVGAPFVVSSPAYFDAAAAERNAIGHSASGTPIIRARTLRRTGPYFVNPPNADWSNPIVLRRGSVVPGRVPTVDVVNASVRGLVPAAHYDVFVSQRGRIVFMEPDTRQVARIIR